MALVKNHYYETETTNLSHDGLGVARINGFPVFVADALVGEKITLKIILVKKNHAFGKIIHHHTRSPERVLPTCEIYHQCGGCQIQHLSYKGQLQMKRELVLNHLKRIGHLENPCVLPTMGMDEPWRYRNKTQVPFGRINNEIVAGFYQKRSHKIMDMKTCYIQTEIADQIVATMKGLCQDLGIEPYHEQEHQGVVRHVIVRVGFATTDVMVIIVTRSQKLAHQERIVATLLAKYPQITSIIQNVNPNKTNVIFGAETKLLAGVPYLYDELAGIRFAISPRSFYQINPIQTEVLYRKVVELAGLSGEEIVFDAYCGIGTITLFLAKYAKFVYGVEVIPEAIADARMNAELNGFHNTEFVVGKAEEVILKWIKAGIIPDVVVVDPPRKGCDQALLDALMAAGVKKLIYVSCDSATLARDLKILAHGGYEVKVVQPIDLFPQTAHVETITLLRRR